MKSPNGFTLIELIVLLAIIAILTAVAVPNFSATIKTDRDTSQINTLLAGLALARSSAIQHGNATICAGNTTACSSGNWASGWVVVYLPPAATTQMIRTFPALSGNNTLTSTGGNSFTFNSQGMVSAASTFNLCDPRGPTYAHSVDLNITGRAEAALKVGYEIDGITAIPSC
ncbi:MAG: GspH/FimT family pseudopilin [Gammaproteobacteria bacterium]